MGRVITADEDDVDDGLTAGRQGFIVWGEPHDLNSWEVTPGFLKKWAWTMQGCDELISSTNHWRGIRGEAPLRFSLEVCAGSEPY
ncbi:hypothetical protein N7456_009642 [Penicillium angulare]|uniref:Uncharacterized protein n=1 Tax=Penicillium angulare TaxID=116970 RepID=A0A9W9K5X5_9EURO|nr:hypothetical protein N7456_009642 [Penicillium angulare]